MEFIDALGKPCPIPVIEAKKALSKPWADSVLIKVDNIVAVQNIEKMANGYGYEYSYTEKEKNIFEVMIRTEKKSDPSGEKTSEALDSKSAPVLKAAAPSPSNTQARDSKELVVVIGRNTMGAGDEDLGKILIKGFIYSLTELPVPPACVVFLNSGAYLTSKESNTIADLKRLEERGTQIFTCGTCVNYYKLQDSLAVGSIIDMFGITERMVDARVINI